MALNAGTEGLGDEGQPNAGEGGESAPPPAAADPNASAPPVTTLLSRIAGLDAKVTEQGKAAKAAEDRAKAAEQKLADYEAGKVSADEALRAQLAAEQGKTAEALRAAALARIESKYPETFGVLGEAAATLTPEQLAANEARLAGVGPEESPNPVGNNPARGQAAPQKTIEQMSVAELKAHLAGFDPSVMFSRRSD